MNLAEIALKICLNNYDKVEEYLNGEQTAFNFLQNELMVQTKGHMNSLMCKDLLKTTIKKII